MNQKYFILFWIFFSSGLYAETIGSNSRPCRFNDIVGLGSPDSVLGFAALNGGLRLFNSDTSDEFNSEFSVQGSIDLRGGTLTLLEDLILQNISQISTAGNIVGNGHVLSLSKNIDCVPTGTGYLQLTCDIINTGITSIIGVGTSFSMSIEWSFDNEFVAAVIEPSGSGTGGLRILNPDTLAIIDSELVTDSDYNSVAWNPVYKNLLIVGRDNPPAGGNNLRSFSVSSSGILTLIDSAETDEDVVAVAYHPSGEFVAAAVNITGPGPTAEIHVYSVDLFGNLTFITSVGDVDSFITNGMDWDPSGCFLCALSVTESGSSLVIYSFDGETLTDLVDTDMSVNHVDWNPVYPTRIICVSTSDIQLVTFDYDTETISSIETIATQANDLQAVKFDASGQCFGAVGTGGPEIAIYSFDPNDGSATLIDTRDQDSTDSLAWAQGISDRVVFGYDNGASVAIVELYNTDFEFIPVTGCFEWGNIDLCLNSNLCLQDCCITFTGNSTIDGQGNCLTIKPTCTIQIGEDSSLLLNNIIVQGLQASNIMPLSSSSTVTLKNVQLFLSDDFSFINGSLDILKNVSISGIDHTFSYQSSQKAIINANSTLKLNDALIFDYAPTNSNSINLLELADNTSTLFLKGATLKLTTTNLQLTKGIVSVDRNSKIESI